MEQIVVDVDGTLVVEGKVSRFLFGLASFCQRMGRRWQHPNSRLVESLNSRGKVIVLTSRDMKDEEFTASQLRRAGLKFDSIISAPRKDVLTKWKIEIVTRFGANGKVIWVDDVFRDSTLRRTIQEDAVSILSPEEFAGPEAVTGEEPFEGL